MMLTLCRYVYTFPDIFPRTEVSVTAVTSTESLEYQNSVTCLVPVTLTKSVEDRQTTLSFSSTEIVGIYDVPPS